MTETDLQTDILAALKRAGFWAFRCKAGKNARSHSSIPSGTPDICVVWPASWLEVKLPPWNEDKDLKKNGETALAQKEWRARADRLGVRHAVVTSVAEALAIVKEWRD